MVKLVRPSQFSRGDVAAMVPRTRGLFSAGVTLVFRTAFSL